MPDTQEEKDKLIADVVNYLVIRSEIEGATGPQEDLFYLLRAIVNDQTHTIGNKTRLVIALKKDTNLWHRAAPYLRNWRRDWCDTKGCGHHLQHHPELVACTEEITTHDRITWAKTSVTACKCKGFKPRLL